MKAAGVFYLNTWKWPKIQRHRLLDLVANVVAKNFGVSQVQYISLTECKSYDERVDKSITVIYLS